MNQSFKDQLIQILSSFTLDGKQLLFKNKSVAESSDKNEWIRECQNSLYTQAYANSLTTAENLSDQNNILINNYDWVKEYENKCKNLDEGWQVLRESTNKEVRITSQNVCAISKAGHYLWSGNSNSQVKLYNPKVMENEKDVFTYLMGDQSQNLADTGRVRIYINSKPDEQLEVVKLLTSLFNTSRIPFILKFLKYKNMYANRNDNLVVYINKEQVNRAVKLLMKHTKEITSHLNKSCPLFVYQIIPGVGFGESPPNPSDSFGISRCRILSIIMYDLLQENIPMQKWFNEMKERIELCKFDFDRIYLNPNSNYYYTFLNN